ncbi:MAG: 16S rRNA (cytosine(967)-C(5))-methyltransferase RsmB [Acidobacteriota bacterium]|nr:16S rRNA (cytosine(967)-C(5))-methyltransferase RsmB [Acidobacteriota bacterium]
MSGGGPSPARSRAVEILREILERGGRATPLLAARGGGLSREDHDLLRRIVLGVLRHRSSLDAELAAASRIPWGKLAPPLREVLEVALYQIRHLDRVPDYAAVDQAVRHARRNGGEGAARLVNAILRNVLRSAPGAPPAASETASMLALRTSHPEFLVRRWLERFGRPATLSILEADNAPSGVDLLVNPRRTDRAALSAALAAEGIETEASPMTPLGLTIRSGNAVASPLFRSGQFSIQDAAGQALPLLLPAGETLVDLAAAPGGKSFAAVSLGRARRTIALDRSPTRLERLLENRRRLGLCEVLPVAGDVLAPPLPSRAFARVLFDAPCSGTGTLRKNPEIRYRVTPEAIERLAAAQERGLASAASLLAPGGFLLFSTCSLEEEENERVVARVLARDPELEPAPIEAPEGLSPFVSGSLFRVLPDESRDGFTAHLLRRRT